MLLDFLKFEHAEENLYFFEAVENLKLIEPVEYSDAGPDADFFEGWRKIMKRHINPGCPEAVNLPHDLNRALLDLQSGAMPNVTRQAVTKELEKAEKEVVGMIAGVFPRFQASSIFKGYTQSVLGDAHSVPGSGVLPTSSRTRAFVPNRVLLCERHELTGSMIAAILNSRKYNITVVSDGDIALKRLKEDSFNIVLVNSDLPVVNAIQLLNLYKAASKHSLKEMKNNVKSQQPKFICMLQDANKKLKKNVLSAGYSAIVMKPFSFADFERAKAESAGGVSKLLLGMQSLLD